MIGWSLVALSAAVARRPRRRRPIRRASRAIELRQPPTPAGTERLGHATSSGSRRWRAQQGVRESTIQANVPGLTINQRVIELERTEPVARSSGGVVGALAPYLRSARHRVADPPRPGAITPTTTTALRSIEARYGVDPAVLMAI